MDTNSSHSWQMLKCWALPGCPAFKKEVKLSGKLVKIGPPPLSDYDTKYFELNGDIPISVRIVLATDRITLLFALPVTIVMS